MNQQKRAAKKALWRRAQQSVPGYELRYLQVCEAAAWLFAVRLFVVHGEQQFVALALVVFTTFQMIRFCFDWFERQRIRAALDEISNLGQEETKENE